MSAAVQSDLGGINLIRWYPFTVSVDPIDGTKAALNYCLTMSIVMNIDLIELLSIEANSKWGIRDSNGEPLECLRFVQTPAFRRRLEMKHIHHSKRDAAIVAQLIKPLFMNSIIHPFGYHQPNVNNIAFAQPTTKRQRQQQNGALAPRLMFIMKCH